MTSQWLWLHILTLLRMGPSTVSYEWKTPGTLPFQVHLLATGGSWSRGSQCFKLCIHWLKWIFQTCAYSDGPGDTQGVTKQNEKTGRWKRFVVRKEKWWVCGKSQRGSWVGNQNALYAWRKSSKNKVSQWKILYVIIVNICLWILNHSNDIFFCKDFSPKMRCPGCHFENKFTINEKEEN